MPLWLAMRGLDPYLLRPGVDVTIGRGRQCDLSIYSSLLSREHARIRWENEQPVLFDLGSLNGCYVGVDKVLRHTLEAGDVIRMGDLLIKVVDSVQPPPPLEAAEDQEDPRPDVTPSAATETRIFHRTSALHQQVFAYDEMAWLLERIPFEGPVARALLADSVEGPSLEAWLAEAPRDREPALWELLRVGVVAPVTHMGGRVNMDARAVAAAAALAPRGEKLRRRLQGRRTHWNEMASLRYRARQSVIFEALRRISRAYRPGGLLTDVGPAQLIYELRMIYAATVPPEQMELELRRLLCLGILAPLPGVGSQAWYPADWEAAPIEISPRGYALFEGFRLEEEEVEE
ncbi:MAG: FHA domain-containing protein [Planctomycetota bacterium]